MLSQTNKDLSQLEDEVESSASAFIYAEIDEELNEYDSMYSSVATDSFLAVLPPARRALVQEIAYQATNQLFPTHAQFVHDEGLDSNGMHGFYTRAERIAFYNKHKELFKACIEEEADRLHYLTVLDWYIRLDYPTYQVGTTEGFELTNELMTEVFVDLKTTNIEHDGMADALVREILLETATGFVKFSKKKKKTPTQAISNYRGIRVS